MDKFIATLLTEHRGKCIGALIGLLVSILFITAGFWQTMLVLVFIGLGYVIGKSLDDPQFAERIIGLFKKD
ncbi:MAG: DUF2273 domain-containing protein [Syntrophomonadaceae bacterium]|nr:DUF2273 domain-containing protein [Syntrophomonadaceae bacterium]